MIQWLLHDALPRAEWIALLGDVIERWTREQPLVTTHAIPLDPGVLAGLLGRPLPLLIVTCGAEPDSRSLRLKLGPLDREAQSRLLAQLIGFDRDLAFRVEQMSEGNPGFAVQIVNHWLETACVVPSATGLRLAKGVTPEPPASLIQAHAARTDRLLTSPAPNEVHALEIAAMLGDRVARHTWEQACEMAWVDPGDVLARSIDAGVLASTDDRRDAHQFTHALFRQHLVGLADQGGRTARWCAAAADALEPDAPLALRASLLSRADRPAQAFEAQARHLIQLLSAGEVRHHDAFEVLRLLDAAATAAHPGRGEARRQARIWELTAWAARLRGEDSTEAAHKAHTAAACSGDPAALFDATVALAHLAMEAADTTKAIDLFELAARYAAAAEDPAHVWFCHQEIASANMTRGRWDLAAAHVAQQPTDLRVGHKVELELQRARVAWDHRDEDRFRTHLERASEEADRAGQRRPHIRIENLRGEMHRKAGRLDEAMRCYQRGLSDAVRLQLTFDRMLLLANVALTQALLSRFQEAHETVEELRRLDPPRMFRTFLNPLTVAARAGLGLPVDDAIAAVEHDVETLSVADLDIAVLLELAMGLVPEGPIHERLRALASIHRGGVR